MKPYLFCPKCGERLRESSGYQRVTNGARGLDKVPDSVREEYETGASLLDLSTKHQTTPHFVRIKIASLGGTIRQLGQHNRKIPKERVEEIGRRIEAGETFEAIAADFNVARERIRQIGISLGAVTKVRERKKRERVEQYEKGVKARDERLAAARATRAERMDKLSELWKSGLSSVDIAFSLGVSQQYVNSAVSEGRVFAPEKFPYRK